MISVCEDCVFDNKLKINQDYLDDHLRLSSMGPRGFGKTLKCIKNLNVKSDGF
jgi:hypothetical protein